MSSKLFSIKGGIPRFRRSPSSEPKALKTLMKKQTQMSVTVSKVSTLMYRVKAHMHTHTHAHVTTAASAAASSSRAVSAKNN